MTEKPETDHVVTVAELLARHGQASGTSGRAHRRRAREGGISVAELTGEIPIIRDATPPQETDTREPEAQEPEAPSADAVEVVAEQDTAAADVAVEEPAAEESATDPDDAVEAADFAEASDPQDTRAYSALGAVADAGPQSPREFASTEAFPTMAPLASSIMAADEGGQAVADIPDVEDSAAQPAAADLPADPQDDAQAEPQQGALRQWLALGAQAVVGVAVGAALFLGFERLWDNLPYVALVLAILIILAMVAVVRVLRKTDDIVSLLLAVVVGVIVTIGPLAFVLSAK